MNKEMLRKEYLKLRSKISKKIILDKSKIIMDKLKSSKDYINSENIFVFVSFGNEVHTHDFIKESLREGKNIFVPLVDNEKKIMRAVKITDMNQLSPGVMGILEPKGKEFLKSEDFLDLIVTPGLIFDEKGCRIGYGGGYYDKFFTNIVGNQRKVGVAFDFQFVKTLPVDKTDVKIDALITDERLIEFK